MSSSSAIAPPFSANQRAALLNLLSDEDPEVYEVIREKILSGGPETIGWLDPYLLSNDPLLRRRSRDIILHLRRQEADTDFLAFCLNHGRQFDLEDAAWHFARTEYPDINVEGYKALLDHHATQLGDRLDGSEAPREVLAEVNNYLFDEWGMKGNEENYYDPENSYLNRVLDRRTGNPINLSLVYILVARRLKLPVSGIGLPGHFICRYQSTREEVYVDAFDHGRLLAKADCIQYLLRGKYSLREDFLSPVSPRQFLMRVCSNLHKIFLQRDMSDRATRMQRYLIALAK
jgi:regulator of sirC expression with transglutaminase-like and TPR domain